MKDVDYQMRLRGAKSDKQHLTESLERAFLKATSEKDFYQKLRSSGFDIYLRNGKEVGILLKRKYRFTTLGYTKEILKGLEKNKSVQHRRSTLDRIRKQQQSKNLDRER